MNEKSLPAQKNESVYVIFYGSPITICGYALSREEAISICARHNAVYPFATRYVYLKIARLHGKTASQPAHENETGGRRMSGENRNMEWGETAAIFFGVISFIQHQSREAAIEAEKILDDLPAKYDKEILSRLHETAKMHRSIAEAAENLAFVWERQRKKTNRRQHETF